MRPRALLIVLPLLAALTAPRAYAARAAATQAMGCSRYGYTMLVPASWAVFGGCTTK